MDYEKIILGLILVFIVAVSIQILEDAVNENKGDIVEDFNLDDKTESSETPYLRKRSSGNNNSWRKESALQKGNLSEGIYEINRYPDSLPSERQLQNAWRLYNRSFETAKDRGWFNYSEGLKDDFIEADDPSHYPNLDNLKDGSSLNPEKPEYLIYYDYGEKKTLAGFMFRRQSIGDRGGQIGGPLTVWHYHKYNEKWCLRDRFYRMDNIEDCSPVNVTYKSPEMLHVWFIRRSGGQFATDMSLDDNEKPQKLNKKEFMERELRILKEETKG